MRRSQLRVRSLVVSGVLVRTARVVGIWDLGRGMGGKEEQGGGGKEGGLLELDVRCNVWWWLTDSVKKC